MTHAFWLFNSWNKDKGYINSYAYEKSRKEYSKLRTEINLKNNPFKGRKHTEEWKQEQSVRSKSRWTDPEYRNKLTAKLKAISNTEEFKKAVSERMIGKNTWTKGALWWNNGVECKRSKECPGPEWEKGRLNYRNKAINI